MYLQAGGSNRALLEQGMKTLSQLPSSCLGLQLLQQPFSPTDADAPRPTLVHGPVPQPEDLQEVHAKAACQVSQDGDLHA